MINKQNNINTKKNNASTIILAVILVILFLIPVLNINGAMALAMHLGIMTFTYILISQSWNVLAGLCGLFSLGHAAFYGLGGYCMGIFMMKLGLNPIIGLIAGILCACIFAVVLGAISSKLSGFFFTMSTIALGEVLKTAASQMISITNGSIGLAIPRPSIPRPVFYYIAFALAIAGTVFVIQLRKSRIGSMFVAIRENENLSKALGVNTNFYKTLAAVISAIMAAIGGAFMAYYIQVVDVSYLSSNISNKVVIVSIVGGIGNAFGPVFGSLVILLEELIRGKMGSDFAPLATALYSIILIAMIMIKPNGIVSINLKKSANNLKKCFSK